jgi:hypothetical protein
VRRPRRGSHKPFPPRGTAALLGANGTSRRADISGAALGLGGDWQGNRYQVKPCPPGFDALNDTLDDDAYRSLRACPHLPARRILSALR